MPPIRPTKSGKFAAMAKSKAKRRVPGASSSSSSTKPVALRDLKWKGVSIPSMSLEAGPAKGKRVAKEVLADEVEEVDEWDPFAELDEGADDFMGLQEVSGVGVSFQEDEHGGGKKVGFYQVGIYTPQTDTSAATNAAGEPQKEQQENKKKKKQIAKKAEKKASREATKEPASKASDVEKTASGPAVAGSSHDASKSDDADLALPDESSAAGSDAEESVAEPSQPLTMTSQGQDEAIPEGIFSAFAANIDESDDADQDQLGSAEFQDDLLSSWPKSLLPGLHPSLKRALHNLSFTRPTPIQTAVLPHTLPTSGSAAGGVASRPRDIVGLAQTGSGKTLAYALPILQRVIASRTSIYADDDRPLQALIILPTRELALQVYEVLQKLVRASVTDAAEAADGSSSATGTPWVRIAPVVGGMSEERQWRLLRGRKTDQNSGKHKDAEIIIATVGRLWELCKSDDYLPTRLEEAEMLVLDEADRLLEAGKFQELSSILNLLKSPQRQTMMFSATLDPTLQVNLSKSRSKVCKALKLSRDQDKMAKLVEKVGFNDPQGAKIIDLTKNALVNENLKEGKIECLENEKDLYLYYLLLRYPGSSLVFLNSIDSVRRLHPLLTNLGLQSFPLHGDMDQRSRLRALDNFKKSFSSSKPSVLLATDVAARGLDIPLVSHVMHFHLPRSADTYIHRSGRTARAGHSGLSLILLSPGEKSRWNALRKSGLQRDADLPELEIVYGILPRLKKRVQLAKQLDEARHRERKERADDDWVRKLAEEADIVLDEDDVDPDADFAVSSGSRKGKGKHDDDAAPRSTSSKASKEHRAALKALEAELREELRADLVVRGVKRKYITQGAGLGIGTEEGLQGLVDGTGHDTFIGMGKSEAAKDLGSGKKKKKQKQKPQL